MLVVFDGITQEELDEIIDRVNERNCPWIRERREREEKERKRLLFKSATAAVATQSVRHQHFHEAYQELKRIRQAVIDHKTDLCVGDMIALGPEGFVFTV